MIIIEYCICIVLQIIIMIKKLIYDYYLIYLKN